MCTQCKYALAILRKKKLLIIWFIVSFFLLLIDISYKKDLIYGKDLENILKIIIDNVKDFKLDNILLVVTIITAFIPFFELIKEEKILGIDLAKVYNNLSSYDILLKVIILLMVITKLLDLYICFIAQFFTSLFLILFYFYDVLSIKGKYKNKKNQIWKVIKKEFEDVKSTNKLNDFSLISMFENIKNKDFDVSLSILEKFLKEKDPKYERFYFALIKDIIRAFFRNTELFNDEMKKGNLCSQLIDTFIYYEDCQNNAETTTIHCITIYSILLIELLCVDANYLYVKNINEYVKENLLIYRNEKDMELIELNSIYIFMMINYLNEKDIIKLNDEGLEQIELFEMDEIGLKKGTLEKNLFEGNHFFYDSFHFLYKLYDEQEINQYYIDYEFFTYVSNCLFVYQEKGVII
ncbi:hypothetical protein [[Eubacterium] hominis]|uniref:hypothetical protein n=1 Tax=[Eubacterium] hominis TaxID=2764325 RepID=UPI003A4DDDCD